jgi:hypothetical protein
VVVGTAWPHGPWWILRKLPLYQDLRVPSRYLVLVALSLSVWAAKGLDEFTAWLARRGVQPGQVAVVAAAAVVLVLAEVLAFNVPTYRDARFVALHQPPDREPAFHQTVGDWRDMLAGVVSRLGTLKCDEEAPLQRGELDDGPGDQVRLLDPSAGTAQLERWTPNELVIGVDVSRPSDVLVNENWNEHWHAEGGAVKSVAGRLAVAVEPGRHTVLLRYRPRSFTIGAWLSAISLPAAALAFVLLRRRRSAISVGGHTDSADPA